MSKYKVLICTLLTISVSISNSILASDKDKNIIRYEAQKHELNAQVYNKLLTNHPPVPEALYLAQSSIQKTSSNAPIPIICTNIVGNCVGLSPGDACSTLSGKICVRIPWLFGSCSCQF